MSRDAFQQMRYIRGADMPPGAGLGGSTKEDFIRNRHAFTDPRMVSIKDARTCLPGGLAAWNLTEHGFMMIQPPTPPRDFRSQASLNEEYYPKLAELLTELTGAKDCLFFYDLVRTEDRSNPGNAYAGFAHTDCCAGSAEACRRQLLRNGVPEAEAMSCDIMMGGIWHPVDRPAYKDPLCLLDGSSIRNSAEELRRIDYNYKRENVENYLDTLTPAQWQKFAGQMEMFGRVLVGGKHPSEAGADPQGPRGIESTLTGPMYFPHHRWVFCSDQHPDECWFFKHYDTRDDAGVKQAFHTSFHDPFHEDESDATHGRRSAEFRCILTFPKKKGVGTGEEDGARPREGIMGVVKGTRGNARL